MEYKLKTYYLPIYLTISLLTSVTDPTFFFVLIKCKVHLTPDALPSPTDPTSQTQPIHSSTKKILLVDAQIFTAQTSREPKTKGLNHNIIDEQGVFPSPISCPPRQPYKGHPSIQPLIIECIKSRNVIPQSVASAQPLAPANQLASGLSLLALSQEKGKNEKKMMKK